MSENQDAIIDRAVYSKSHVAHTWKAVAFSWDDDMTRLCQSALNSCTGMLETILGVIGRLLIVACRGRGGHGITTADRLPVYDGWSSNLQSLAVQLGLCSEWCHEWNVLIDKNNVTVTWHLKMRTVGLELIKTRWRLHSLGPQFNAAVCLISFDKCGCVVVTASAQGWKWRVCKNLTFYRIPQVFLAVRRSRIRFWGLFCTLIYP